MTGPEVQPDAPRKSPIRARLATTAAVAVGVALGVLPYYLMTTRPWEDNGSEGLAGRVEQSMQHNLDSNQLAQYHLSVKEVTVIPEVGNKYEGLATIRTAKGTQRDVAVHVVAASDGTMIWRSTLARFFLQSKKSRSKTARAGREISGKNHGLIGVCVRGAACRGTR